MTEKYNGMTYQFSKKFFWPKKVLKNKIFKNGKFRRDFWDFFFKFRNFFFEIEIDWGWSGSWGCIMGVEMGDFLGCFWSN